MPTHTAAPLAGAVLIPIVLMLAACATPSSTVQQPPARVEAYRPSLIPLPTAVEERTGEPFVLHANTRVTVQGNSADAQRVGTHLGALIGRLANQPGAASGSGEIVLSLEGADSGLGEEGYSLEVDRNQVLIRANAPAGLFYGVQTLRQLLPPRFEAPVPGSGTWAIAPVRITDRPQYTWRGAMLDVARHFFGLEDLKRYVDLLSTYKMNRLHLHLSDDQGWRIEIASWPRLTTHGGSTSVGGGKGGFLTQAQYSELDRYARERFVTIIPEIDLPGHTNAALSSYPELSCDGKPREMYTGIEVGFSAVCVEKETTYKFVDDVVRELAAITSGPWIHIGGDEVATLTKEQYGGFMTRAQQIVVKHGKQPVGWDEIVHSEMLPSTVVQLWAGDVNTVASAKQARFVMSPAAHAYIDMKYHAQTPLGLAWAGFSDTRDSYSWDPAKLLPGVSTDRILGVEAPLWTETITNMNEIEFMVFPRLLGIAEIGWSAPEGRNWETYRQRLALQGPRMTALGIDFYRDAGVDW